MALTSGSENETQLAAAVNASALCTAGQARLEEAILSKARRDGPIEPIGSQIEPCQIEAACPAGR